MEKHPQIICTLGSAIDSEEDLRALLSAGMDMAYVDASSSSREDQKRLIKSVQDVRDNLGVSCSLVFDIAGSEIRTGSLSDGESLQLHAGDSLILVQGDSLGGFVCLKEGQQFQGRSSAVFRISYTGPNLASSLQAGRQILLDEGAIELSVVEISGDDIRCLVDTGGTLEEHTVVHVPGVATRESVIPETDANEIIFGIAQGVDCFAISSVRTAADVFLYKNFLEAKAAADIKVFAKIETSQAVQEIKDIASAADGIIIMRSELCAEEPVWHLPAVQKKLIHAAKQAGVPAIIADQVLDSMTHTDMPSRADVVDVTGALTDGADAVILSSVTSEGEYALEALRIMALIAQECGVAAS